MKKILIALIFIVAALAVMIVGLVFQVNRQIKQIETEYASLQQIDISAIPDGTYAGKFGSIPNYVNLSITIKDRHIAAIEIKRQISGKGYDAKETIDRIVIAQKTKVDAVSGATMSSKCIMVAVSKALKRDAK